MPKTRREEMKNAAAATAAAAKAKDLPQAAVAPEVSAPKPSSQKPSSTRAAKGGNDEKKVYYDAAKHDKVIDKFLSENTELVQRLKDSFDYDVNARIFKPFKEKGTYELFQRFRNLVYGDYLIVGNALLTLANKKDKDTGEIKRAIIAADVIEYVAPKIDKETKQVVEKGYYKTAPLKSILTRLEQFKVPKAKWNEFLQNGFIEGTVGKRMFLSKRAEDLKQEGKFMDVEMEDLRNYRKVYIVCAAPNGIPIVRDAGAQLDAWLTMCEKEDGKGRTFKDGNSVYELSEKDIRNLCANRTVVVIGQDEKGAVTKKEIHFDGFFGKVSQVEFLTGRKALKKAGYSYEAPAKGQEEEESYEHEAEAEAGQDAGISPSE